MSRAGNLRTGAAAVGAVAAVPLLLRRMRREFQTRGQLSAASVGAMYACYTAHAAATVLAARNQIGALAIPTRPAAATGGLLAAGGAGLCIAGMGRFAGPAQLSGTDAGSLSTAGVYRYSRNPQYAGYVAFLAGAGLARRSAAVLALAGAVGLVFSWWVPVEERSLEREFGDAYRLYREQVPRWLGPTGAASRGS